MGRSSLLVFLLLFGCDISRDLRPELFACDAGGPCGPTQPDAGPPIACPFGTTCRCMEGRACNFRCTGECSIQCLTGSFCQIDCGAASCNTICSTGAECRIACSAGACDTICDEGSSCEIDCSLAQCTCTGPECPF